MKKKTTHKSVIDRTLHNGAGIDCPVCKKVYEMCQTQTPPAVTGNKTGGKW